MAREVINVTRCDKCHEEIPQGTAPYSGVRWDNQGVDTNLRPDGKDIKYGDYCATCYIEKLDFYLQKLKKLHNVDQAPE